MHALDISLCGQARLVDDFEPLRELQRAPFRLLRAARLGVQPTERGAEQLGVLAGIDAFVYERPEEVAVGEAAATMSPIVEAVACAGHQ